ncbi:uncharacterized protein LOC111596565 [Drosophila hydei]|uniref:Uncharacterized protein LOC111596565 n=1 Tax=Drosophila hydei TaxID=7224 RepID=A0A6J1LS70_DROHY|nr:uncharacterized protein LOC111596565 [Drosophila hydei]
MSTEYFPRVFKYITNLSASNKELYSVFIRLENALNEKEELKAAREKLQKDVQNLRIDLMLVRQANNVRHEEITQIEGITNILDGSYDRLLELGNLFDDGKIKNMLSFGVLRKEKEVLQKISSIQMEQKMQLDFKVAMEQRLIVQDLRESQRELQEAEEEHSAISLEYTQMQRKWNDKLDRAIEQRNKKIVSLVQLSKQASEFQMPVSHKIKAMTVKDCEAKAVALRKKNEPIKLQPALEFIERYTEANQIFGKAIGMENSMGPPLRSILVLNRSMDSSNESVNMISPNKQVHFAPLPSPPHVSNTDPVMNDLSTDMADISDMNSESSQSEVENMTESKYFPDRSVVENVEVLPPLSLSISSASNRFGQNVSFKNMFPSTDSMQEQDFEDNKNEMGNDDNSNESEIINVNNMDTLNFANASEYANNDFFLNLSDQNSSQQQSYTYDL